MLCKDYFSGAKIYIKKESLQVKYALILREQTSVVQRLDRAIHRINHYPADSVVCFVNTYPLDSDLAGR